MAAPRPRADPVIGGLPTGVEASRRFRPGGDSLIWLIHHGGSSVN